MNVEMLKSAVDAALARGLNPETSVVIAHEGWYFHLSEDIEEPTQPDPTADMWFTLSFAEFDGKPIPCDARFSQGHTPVPDKGLFEAFEEMWTMQKEDDPTVEPETYVEWLSGQIDNHEQIWRESARSRDRDSTEQYLQVLRREHERFTT